MRKYEDGSLGSLSLSCSCHEDSGSPRLREAEGHGCKPRARGARPTGLRNAEGSRAHGGWDREVTRTGLNYQVPLNLSELIRPKHLPLSIRHVEGIHIKSLVTESTAVQG